MADRPDPAHDAPPGDIPLREWVRALVLLVVLVVVAHVALVWFAFAFLFSSCCVAPG